jgi:hypothetical protein
MAGLREFVVQFERASVEIVEPGVNRRQPDEDLAKQGWHDPTKFLRADQATPYSFAMFTAFGFHARCSS